MEKKEPRIILPSKKQSDLQIITSPSIDQLLTDAQNIIAIEIAKYSRKAQDNGTGKFLTPQEARIVQGYMETLVKIQKEQREADDARDLANATTEELIKLIEAAKGVKK